MPKARFRVAEHPTLGQYAGQITGGLETEFERRTFVLVSIADMTRSSGGTSPACCFGARRPNGTLTEVIWPDESGSNLVYEVGQQVKASENSKS